MSASSPPAQEPNSRWRWLRELSAFEKAIAANSAIILLDTAAGWWITQHNPETYHYLIDTTFIALAALAGLVVNFALLRAAFAPLRRVLATIRAVEQGDLAARVEVRSLDRDALTLARAFNAMLDRLEAARHETAAHVLYGQEKERRRLALELHDQTGQSLTALTLLAEAITQRLSGEPGVAANQASQQAKRLAALAQRTLAEVQVLSRELRPPMLDDLALEASLRWLAEDAGERLGVSVRLRCRGVAIGADEALGGHLSDEAKTSLFRIAQESLTNAVRHGHAHHVWIVLAQSADRVTLTVADDGRGFDQPARTTRAGSRASFGGLGLEGMSERARALGGTLKVRTRAGRGCVVRVGIGLPAPSTEDARDAAEPPERHTLAAPQQSAIGRPGARA